MLIECVGILNRPAERAGAAEMRAPFGGSRGFFGERQRETVEALCQPKLSLISPQLLFPRTTVCLFSGASFVPGVESPSRFREQFIDAEQSFSSRIERESESRGIRREMAHVEESLRDEDIVPYVGLLRSLIETDQIPAARRVLDAIPLRVRDHPPIRKLAIVLARPIVRCIPKKDVDRKRDYEWLRAEGRNYRGQWVALDEGELVASARTLCNLREQLAALRLPRPPLIHRIE